MVKEPHPWCHCLNFCCLHSVDDCKFLTAVLKIKTLTPTHETSIYNSCVVPT